MRWQDRIEIDSSGRPSVKGSSVSVSTILGHIADGLYPEEITRYYPSLTVDDVKAVLRYAAETLKHG